MNVNELAGSIYHTHYPQHVVSLPHTGQLASSAEPTKEQATVREFSDILSDYITDDYDALTEDKDLLKAVQELAKSVENLKAESQNTSSSSNVYDNFKTETDVMSILTDQEKAMDYLSHQSGRNLIVEMATNSIASIISGAS